ncbi:MAG: type II toxin-antitoxin system RelE/ParE family toxin [Beijerinckiaceae bacterium]
MTKWISVVETAAYLATADVLMTEDERAAVVDMVAQDPQAGDLMPGTGGLRKLRVPLPGRGKRGGGRLITFFHDAGMPVFLIALYAKNVQSDLDPQQRRAAKVLTDAVRAQYGR